MSCNDCKQNDCEVGSDFLKRIQEAVSNLEFDKVEALSEEYDEHMNGTGEEPEPVQEQAEPVAVPDTEFNRESDEMLGVETINTPAPEEEAMPPFADEDDFWVEEDEEGEPTLTTSIEVEDPIDSEEVYAKMEEKAKQIADQFGIGNNEDELEHRAEEADVFDLMDSDEEEATGGHPTQTPPTMNFKSLDELRYHHVPIAFKCPITGNWIEVDGEESNWQGRIQVSDPKGAKPGDFIRPVGLGTSIYANEWVDAFAHNLKAQFKNVQDVWPRKYQTKDWQRIVYLETKALQDDQGQALRVGGYKASVGMMVQNSVDATLAFSISSMMYLRNEDGDAVGAIPLGYKMFYKKHTTGAQYSSKEASVLMSNLKNAAEEMANHVEGVKGELMYGEDGHAYLVPAIVNSKVPRKCLPDWLEKFRPNGRTKEDDHEDFNVDAAMGDTGQAYLRAKGVPEKVENVLASCMVSLWNAEINEQDRLTYLGFLIKELKAVETAKELLGK